MSVSASGTRCRLLPFRNLFVYLDRDPIISLRVISLTYSRIQLTVRVGYGITAFWWGRVSEDS